MGNDIPRHPCTGCLDRPVYADSAKNITVRERLINTREREKALIKEEALFSRIRKLGRVWEIDLDNKRDSDMIDLIKDSPGGADQAELDACPGLYRRDVVVYSDEDGPDVTVPEYLCGTRAQINRIDTSENLGWQLVNPQDIPPPKKIDTPRDDKN